jgi:hypothetical protein
MQRHPEHQDDPVTVFDTPEESEGLVIHGLLTSAGIEASIVPLDLAQNVFPGVGGVTVVVSPERAEEARRLIAEHRGGDSDDASASDEPAA